MTPKPTVLSVFTGAGGLDLGLESAGFRVLLCIENDKDARETLRLNRPHWRLATSDVAECEDGDIHGASPDYLLEQARVSRKEICMVAGGFPCQPFSKSALWATGRSKGLDDPRAATLSACLRLVRAALPEVVLLENVTGFVRRDGSEGLRLIESTLARINRQEGTRYKLSVHKLDAASYGVAQHRVRVLLVAHRAGVVFDTPARTHGVIGRRLPTAWDAIGDLDTDVRNEDLMARGCHADLLASIPEGRNYLWHTSRGGGIPLFGWRTRYWTFLLKLAKAMPSSTIQATAGPATGPFHWKSRRLSCRELARLQSFPDSIHFAGADGAIRRQIGNAVPSALAEVVGLEIRRQLLGGGRSRAAKLAIQPRSDCPPEETPTAVPARCLLKVGRFRPHPGEGLGPGARSRVAAANGGNSG